jgi:glyoxylate reductase
MTVRVLSPHMPDASGPSNDVRHERPEIVVLGAIPEPGLEVLRGAGDTWCLTPGVSAGEFRERLASADAVVSLITDVIDDAFLDTAPRLRIVANVAVGYNNIDVDACRSRGIVVTNTPGVLTEATADLAMGLVLMVTRRLGEGERLIRSGTPWSWGMFMMLGTGLQGRRLGIVGMGDIGQALARRAAAFGMEIVYHNRNRVDPTVEASLDATWLELDELLATSDVVSLNCPYSPATHHLVDAAALAAMRSTAFVVNTARGPIVDEAALASALREGTIAGAALDVFEHEPDVHPDLLGLDNVVLVPHLGSATVETRNAMAALAARNVVAVLDGDDAITPVG